MKSLSLTKVALAVLLASTTLVKADQLDQEAHEKMFGPAPRGVLVKVNPSTKIVEVFKAPELSAKIVDKTASAAETAIEIVNIESSENKIAEFKVPTSELDKDSSTEACWYGGGYGWNNWGGYYPASYNYYQPYYYPGYFNYGCYNYNYGYGYGYNNCYYGWYY
jgi:hypothetical protein